MSIAALMPDLVSLDEFASMVLPVVHNAPEDTIIGYLRDSARDFARQTHVLQGKLYADIQAAVTEYYIDCPNEQLVISAVNAVRVDGAGLLPVIGYTYSPPSDVSLVRIPRRDIADGLEATCSFIPSPTASAVPRRLYDEWAEAIADGAASRLLLMKTADWYDPQSAGIRLRRAKTAIASAKTLVARGHTTAPMVAKITARFV